MQTSADLRPTGLAPEYHQLQLAGRPGVWRPIVGTLTMIVGMFLVVPLIVGAVVTVIAVIAGMGARDVVSQISSTTDVTPLSLAYLNLALAAAIPFAWLLNKVFHNLKPRWLASVRPKLRWGYLVACLGASVVALLATLLVSAMVPAQGGPEMSGKLNEFTDTTRDFILIVLLLTPLQAAGEEYAFRGYLTQAFGGVATRLFKGEWGPRVVAVMGPALLFAFAHGAQSLPIFIDRFAFGLVSGVLVIVTGGLEAGIAMHVLNNFLAFGLALAYGDMAAALNPTGASWWMLATTLTQSLVYLALAAGLAHRMGIARRGPTIPGTAVLSAPAQPV